MIVKLNMQKVKTLGISEAVFSKVTGIQCRGT